MTAPTYIPIDTWRRICAWCDRVMSSHSGPGTGRGVSVYERPDREDYADPIADTYRDPDKARRWSHELTFEEQEANAHLIAATPALYAELESITDAVERMALRLDKELGNQTVVSLWLYKVATARTALAQARGET